MPAIACGGPIVCCQPTAASGITVTGTATVQGRGATARDQAIRAAVADAREQATTAAAAAGAKLAGVVGMQVSSYAADVPVPYATGSSGGVAPACPEGATCPPLQPKPSVSATVTVTWALAS